MSIRKDNRRISIVLNGETHLALGRLAQVRGMSLASVAREALEEAEPLFSEVADALELAQQSPKRAVGMMLRRLDAEVAQVQQQVLPLRRKPGRKRRG